MIVDITGTVLTLGDMGRNCLGNGEREGIECCCDECDYMLCCMETHDKAQCDVCTDQHCPHCNEMRAEVVP